MTMDIAIHDRVDLPDLIEAIGPRAHTAWWRVRGPVRYVADVPIAALGVEKHGTGPWIDGPAFRSQMDSHHILVDAVFEVSLPSEGALRSVWVTLRLVDGIWWEMYSSDVDVIARSQERFSDIRPARYTSSSVYNV